MRTSTIILLCALCIVASAADGGAVPAPDAATDAVTALSDRCAKAIRYGDPESITKPSVSEAIVALGLLGDHRGVPIIVDALANHPNDDVRHQAARALGWMHDPAAVPALTKALEGDSYRFVRDAAAWSLTELTGKPWTAKYTPEQEALDREMKERIKRDMDEQLNRGR